MSKIDVLSDVFNTSHKKNYATGKFEPVDDVDESVIAEDTYSIVATDDIQEDDDITENNELVVEEHIDPDDVDYLQDELEVKRNIKSIIDNGMDLMEDLCENVRDSENPKSFEYAAAFMKTLMDVNEKLLDIHDRKQKRKSITKKESVVGANNISQVNNNIHIYETSPTNILKQIKGKKNNES